MKLGFMDTVRLAVNSLADGVIDKGEVCRMLEDALADHDKDCIRISMAGDDEYPLDSITPEQAAALYSEKGYITLCEDGHVTGIYKERGIAV